jgi:hypothetical protein
MSKEQNRAKSQVWPDFVYAPPQRTGPKEALRLPQPPFKGAKPWQCSVYYYWFEYLRRHEGYAETCKAGAGGEWEVLYRDFGDVHAVTFLEWWGLNGDRLFAEPVQLEEVRFLSAGSEVPASIDVAVVAIPLRRSLTDSLTQIRELLSGRAAAVQGRGKRQPHVSRARYPVFQRPNLSALHSYLEAWDVQRKYPDISLTELAAKLKIGSPKGAKPGGNLRMVVPANEACRRVRKARRLIDNVVRGLFPKY